MGNVLSRRTSVGFVVRYSSFQTGYCRNDNSSQGFCVHWQLDGNARRLEAQGICLREVRPDRGVESRIRFECLNRPNCLEDI